MCKKQFMQANLTNNTCFFLSSYRPKNNFPRANKIKHTFVVTDVTMYRQYTFKSVVRPKTPQNTKMCI